MFLERVGWEGCFFIKINQFLVFKKLIVIDLKIMKRRYKKIKIFVSPPPVKEASNQRSRIMRKRKCIGIELK
jgi:hypothetical protein